jgi:hypothetical protein
VFMDMIVKAGAGDRILDFLSLRPECRLESCCSP